MKPTYIYETRYESMKPVGYWWRRDGGVALVAHVTTIGGEYPLHGMLFAANGSPHSIECWTPSGRTSIGGERPFDIIDYIGPEPPATYTRPEEKKWRPWKKEELYQHADSWFIRPGVGDVFMRPTQFCPDHDGEVRIGGIWKSTDELLRCGWKWVRSLGDQPQLCGVEE